MLIKRCFLVFVVVELAAPQFLTAQQTTAPVDKVASVYGAKVHYVDAGTGSPVILMHGLADDVGVWESAIAPLAAKYRVVAPDQIGFRSSDKQLLNYRASTFIDFHDGILNQLTFSHVSIVGKTLRGSVR